MFGSISQNEAQTMVRRKQSDERPLCTCLSVDQEVRSPLFSSPAQTTMIGRLVDLFPAASP